MSGRRSRTARGLRSDALLPGDVEKLTKADAAAPAGAGQGARLASWRPPTTRRGDRRRIEPRRRPGRWPERGDCPEGQAQPPLDRELVLMEWCRWRDLNPRPPAYEADALPLSYTGHMRAVNDPTRERKLGRRPRGGPCGPQSPAGTQSVHDRARSGEQKCSRCVPDSACAAASGDNCRAAPPTDAGAETRPPGRRLPDARRMAPRGAPVGQAHVAGMETVPRHRGLGRPACCARGNGARPPRTAARCRSDRRPGATHRKRPLFRQISLPSRACRSVYRRKRCREVKTGPEDGPR